MARSQYGEHRPFIAAADLSVDGKINRFVKLTGALGRALTPKVNLVSAAGERAAGVLLDKPKADEVASVQVRDVAVVEAGEAIAVGDLIYAGADGRAMKLDAAAEKAHVNTSDAGAAQDAVAGYYCLGYARTASAAAGDLMEIELQVPTLVK
jgi:hypothetical protein